MKQEHYSEALTENDEGWWVVFCKCGFIPGVFPSVEDACDALMDHAYRVGWQDAMHQEHVPGEQGLRADRGR